VSGIFCSKYRFNSVYSVVLQIMGSTINYELIIYKLILGEKI